MASLKKDYEGIRLVIVQTSAVFRYGGESAAKR